MPTYNRRTKMGQAKQRGTYQERLKMAKAKQEFFKEKFSNKSNLISYYWGYKADELTQEIADDPVRLRKCEGFEFTARHLELNGIDNKTAMDLGKGLKDACDYNIAVYTEGRTQQEYGLTEDQFLQQEEMRMHDGIRSFHDKVASKCKVSDTIRDLFNVCVAISTLVAAGKIEQDEYNGDKFGYMNGPDEIHWAA